MSNTARPTRAELEARLAEVLAERDNLHTTNEALQTQVATLTTLPNEGGEADQRREGEPLERQPTQGRSTSTTPTALSTRTSEPKVASPEFFHGQRSKLTTFITQVTLVLTLQSTRFPDERSKVFYAGSFLRDTAFLWFQPLVTADPQPAHMNSFKLFCQELKKTFGDPDEVGTAERQLYALRQRGSVAAYMADFMRYAVQVNWNDDAQAAQFYRGLKDSVKDELSRVGRPHTLAQLQETAIRIDTRLFERQVERGERPGVTNTQVSTNRFSSRAPFVPRTNPTFVKSEPSTTRPFESFRMTATQAPAGRYTRNGKLTPTEYQRRKDNNLCLYCGQGGHQALKCPAAPPARKGSFRATSPKGFTQSKTWGSQTPNA